jgi:Tfp pilus assembly protein PilE
MEWSIEIGVARLNKICLAIASGCAIIFVLSLIAVYAYFNGIVESGKLQISQSLVENQELKERESRSS